MDWVAALKLVRSSHYQLKAELSAQATGVSLPDSISTGSAPDSEQLSSSPDPYTSVAAVPPLSLSDLPRSSVVSVSSSTVSSPSASPLPSPRVDDADEEEGLTRPARAFIDMFSR